MLIAFFAGVWLAMRRAKRYQFTPSQIGDASFWALILGVLGARIVFILQELPYYLANTRELFSIQFRGLTSFGGLVFGLAVYAFYSVRLKRSLLDLLDVVAPATMLAWAIGRVGCLLNGCCYGRACSESGLLCVPVENSTLLHQPAQIYDSLFNLVFLAALLRIEKRGLAQGQVFALFLTFHGLARFIYEFWRAGSIAEVRAGLASSTYWNGLPITEAQAVAAAMVLLGLGLFFAFQRRGMVQQEIPVA